MYQEVYNIQGIPAESQAVPVLDVSGAAAEDTTPPSGPAFDVHSQWRQNPRECHQIEGGCLAGHPALKHFGKMLPAAIAAL